RQERCEYCWPEFFPDIHIASLETSRRAGCFAYPLDLAPADPSHQIRKPRFAAQPIENWLGVELDEVGISSLVGPLQPLECLVAVGPGRVDLRYVIRQDVALACELLQLGEDLVCRLLFPRRGVRHRERGQSLG